MSAYAEMRDRVPYDSDFICRNGHQREKGKGCLTCDRNSQRKIRGFKGEKAYLAAEERPWRPTDAWFQAAPQSWTIRAACYWHMQGGGEDLWFGEKGEGSLVKQAREDRAKAVCFSCPVREECETFALKSLAAMSARSETFHGIWGGRSETELRAILRTGQGRLV